MAKAVGADIGGGDGEGGTGRCIGVDVGSGGCVIMVWRVVGIEVSFYDWREEMGLTTVGEESLPYFRESKRRFECKKSEIEDSSTIFC